MNNRKLLPKDTASNVLFVCSGFVVFRKFREVFSKERVENEVKRWFSLLFYVVSQRSCIYVASLAVGIHETDQIKNGKK